MAPHPPPRGPKRLGVLVLIVLPVLLVVAVALAEALGWPFLRRPLESQLAQKLERPVRISPPFRLHLLGKVRLQAGELWIAAPPGFDAPHLVDAQGLAMDLRYRDLWALRQRPGLTIAEMDVGRLDAHLLRHPDGRSTWQSPRQAEEQAGQPSPPPTVDHLTVGAGQVVLKDARTGVDLVTRFDTQEGEASNEPVSHLATNGRYAGKPLSGELTTRGLLPVAAGSKVAIPAKGWAEYAGVRIDFDGTVTDLAGQRQVKGAVVVSGPSLAVLGQLVNAVLPTTSAFRIKGDIDNEGGIWHANVADARVGSSQLAGNFAFDATGARPQLYGELRGRRLLLADLAPAFGTRSPEGKPVAPKTGRTLPDRPLDLPALRNMDAAIAVNLATLDLGAAFAQPITPLRGRITLEEGRLALTHLDANTARGSLAGSVAVEADREHWQADLAWRNIHLEDWIKVSKSRGKPDRTGQTRVASVSTAKPKSAATSENPNAATSENPPPPYFTGKLQGRAKLSGKGRTTAALLGSLEGEGVTFVRDGSLSHLVVEALGLDVAQGLGLLLKGDEDLPLQCAVFDFEAHQGRIVPRVAVLDTPVTLVQVGGSADLAHETLDLRLVAKPRNFSPFTLRSPLLVHGTFADPHVSAEGGPIAARVAGGLVLGTVNPLAAILPFLDPGDRAEAPPCANFQSNRKVG